ncbi:hypothetical protein BVY03_05240 [bacterium K02(2017)]|nr:hypothetical protein BVY03_05240 [bacterium K02(2017)]
MIIKIFINLIVIVLALIFPFSISQASELPDFLLKNLKVKENKKENGILGTAIAIEGAFKIKPGQKKPISATYRLEFFKDDKPIKASATTSLYKGKTGSVVCLIKRTFTITPGYCFLPHYALDVGVGKSELKVKLSIQAAPKKITDDLKVIKVLNNKEIQFKVNQKAFRSFQLTVHGVRVAKKTKNGDEWDAFWQLKPDPMACVEMKTKQLTDRLFCTPVVKNSYEAAWLSGTGQLWVIKDDPITLSIYDRDTQFDDLIGQISLKINEWHEQAHKIKEMSLVKFIQISFGD